MRQTIKVRCNYDLKDLKKKLCKSIPFVDNYISKSSTLKERVNMMRYMKKKRKSNKYFIYENNCELVLQRNTLKVNIYNPIAYITLNDSSESNTVEINIKPNTIGIFWVCVLCIFVGVFEAELLTSIWIIALIILPVLLTFNYKAKKMNKMIASILQDN